MAEGSLDSYVEHLDANVEEALTHPTGESQAHVGEALVVIAGVEQKAHYLAMDLPNSLPARHPNGSLRGDGRKFIDVEIYR